MDELDKALDITMKGPESDRALAAFRHQAAAWGVALPSVTPLVLDFGLGDFPNVGLIEYWIANEAKAGYCGKYLFVFDGQTCPLHRHHHKHETFLVVQGCVDMICGDVRRRLCEGEVLPVEPGILHSFTGRGPALLLELSMPCAVDDNYFDNPAIPIGGNWRGEVQP